MSDLLNCPFCDGDAIYDEACPGEHFIRCVACEASTAIVIEGGDDPLPLVKERWNRRMHDKRAAAVRDALDLYVAHRLLPELGLASGKEPDFKREDVRNWLGIIDAISALSPREPRP